MTQGGPVCRTPHTYERKLSTSKLRYKGGGMLGQWGAECQSVNSSTWSNLPPPITHAGATGESKSLALGSLPVFIVLDSAEGTN